MPVKPIPDDHHTVSPYLIVRDAAEALAFYARAFGAVEQGRLQGPGGKIAHCEMKIGDSRLMMADEVPSIGAVAPQPDSGHSVSFMIYVEDVDAAFARAVDAGATVVRPLADQFYGLRTGTLVDPFGHQWTLGTQREEVSFEEMQRRMAEMMAGHPAG